MLLLTAFLRATGPGLLLIAQDEALFHDEGAASSVPLLLGCGWVGLPYFPSTGW